MQNVTVVEKEVGETGIPANSVDLVLMSMSYHDVYFKDEGFDVAPEALFAEVNRVLKPGGTLAIIDHVAAAGSGSSAAQDLHRIDMAFAQQDIESRGFKLSGSLDVLRNATDDHTKVVFDPSIRGRTDRFIHRYVKQ
jgi:predicted methyltransferase